MLNSLASYLLGYPADAAAAAAAVSAHVPVRLSAVEAADDNDWLLVDKTGTDDEEEGSASVDATSAPPATSARLTLAVSTTSYPSWQSGQSGQSPDPEERPGSGCGVGLEESWFVTPPPCFTSGSVPLETSPLENLLIEHPSMSVYHSTAAPLSSSVGATPPSRSPQRGGQSSRKLTRPAGGQGARELSKPVRTTAPSSSSSSSSPSPAAAADASPVRPAGRSVQPQPQPRRPNAYSPYQQQQQSAQYRTAQRLVQRAACQQLKRDSSERYNKAREILSSRNKRQRRSDRMQRHSGANNNRKC